MALVKGDPDVSHVDFEHVYEPAEDSYLLTDSIKEIGCGSGIVTAALAILLGVHRCLHICTDINPLAAEASQKTFRVNKVAHAEVVVTDVINGLDRLKGKVDVLMFNPPYVPSPVEELEGDGIQRSWAGGIDGRQVLDRVLPLIGDILAENGVFYLVVINENKPEEIKELLALQGLHGVDVGKRKAGREKLCIQRYSRNREKENTADIAIAVLPAASDSQHK